MSKSSHTRHNALKRSIHTWKVIIKKATGKWPDRKEAVGFAAGFNVGWRKLSKKQRESIVDKVIAMLKSAFKTKPKSEVNNIHPLQVARDYRKSYQHPEPLPGERPQRLDKPLYENKIEIMPSGSRKYPCPRNLKMPKSALCPLLDPDVDKLVKCPECGNAFYIKKWIVYNKKLVENYKCPFCENEVKLKVK